MTTASTRCALSTAQIEKEMSRCPGWRWDESADGLVRSWTFDSFRSVMNCLAQIAEFAEQLNHHPHITTCYTHLQIQLSTHDAQGLTVLDFQLAEAIDSLIERSFITT